MKKQDDEERKSQKKQHGDASVPIRTPYLYSLLIKMSGLCGIILLFMVIGTAHTNNILVEENVLVQMNREETIRMNRLNLNTDPKSTSLMSDQYSLEPSTLAAYSDALVKRITNSLPTSIWNYDTNSTEFERNRFRGSIDDNLESSFEIPPWLLNPWNPSDGVMSVTEEVENTRLDGDRGDINI